MQRSKIIQQYLETIWFDRNLDVIEEVFADNAEVFSPISTSTGSQGKKTVSSSWINALDNSGISFNFLEENDSMVAANWTCWGNHIAEFFHVPPTNKKLIVEGVSFYWFGSDSNKVVKYKSMVNIEEAFTKILGFNKNILATSKVQESCLQSYCSMIGTIILNRRQLQTLGLWLRGVCIKKSARILNIQSGTVNTYRKQVLEKFSALDLDEVVCKLINDNKVNALLEYSKTLY